MTAGMGSLKDHKEPILRWKEPCELELIEIFFIESVSLFPEEPLVEVDIVTPWLNVYKCTFVSLFKVLFRIQERESVYLFHKEPLM